jgi:hypothetical protein
MGFVEFPLSSLARTSLTLFPGELCACRHRIGVPGHSLLRVLHHGAESRQGLTAPLLVSCTFHRTTPAPLPHPRPPLPVPVRSRPITAHIHAFLAYSVHTLVLPNSSAEDADMFRVLKRVDMTYLSRPSASGNSESAQLCTLTIGKGAGTDLNQPAQCAGGRSYCVSSSCVLSRLFPFRCLTVLHVE